MPDDAAPTRPLSAREREIAGLVAAGKSNRGIAQELFLSERTVEHHVTGVFNKLHLRSRGELMAAVLRGSLEMDSGDTSKGARAKNLPLQLTSFVGRDCDVARITTLLGTHRLVTLTGTGGVGKTRAAIEIGTALEDGTSEGTWFIELAAVRDSRFLASAIASSLGVQESPDRPLLEKLVGYLKTKALVLILDNCEHVIDEARNVSAAILRSCPGIRIIATSREALNITGERAYRLPSLAVPPFGTTLKAEDAVAYGAFALFVDRAAASDAHFEPTDENAPIIAAICRGLDGIPLAIELAASRVKALGLRHLAELLDEHFRVLAGGDRTALPRHRTMQALIDWSYDLLPPSEQRLFDYLSVFAGGCTLASAAAVYATEDGKAVDALAVLSSLVDKSLVVADLDRLEPRYRLLESSRQYAREKLAARGEASAAAHRHALAYLELAERLEAQWLVTPDKQWVAQAQAELENWRAALVWSFGREGDTRLGQRLAAALRLTWWQLAASEGLRWVTVGLQVVDAEASPWVIARLELAAAHLYSRLGRQILASEAGLRALRSFEKLGETFGIADAHRCVGHSLLILERSSEGEPHSRQALELFRAIGARKMIAMTLISLGNASSLHGDFSGARALFCEAISISKGAGAEHLVASAAINLAETEFRSGDPEAALLASADALRGQAAFDDAPVVLLGGLCNMAAYLVALDRWDEAQARARDAVALMRYEQGVASGWGLWLLQHLAAIAALRSTPDLGRAPENVRRAAELLGFVEARLHEQNTFRAFTEQQEYERLRAALHDALGDDELATLAAIGAAMTEDRAIEVALLT